MPGHSHHSTGEGSEPNSMKPLGISQTRANSIKAANKRLIKSAIPKGGRCSSSRGNWLGQNSSFLCYIRINLTSTGPNPRAEDEHRQSLTQLRLTLKYSHFRAGSDQILERGFEVNTTRNYAFPESEVNKAGSTSTTYIFWEFDSDLG